MPRHPDTGKFISNEEYQRIVESRRPHKRPADPNRERPEPSGDQDAAPDPPPAERAPHWDPRGYAPPGWDPRSEQPPRGGYADDRPEPQATERYRRGYVYNPEPVSDRVRGEHRYDEGSKLTGCLVVILFAIVVALAGWMAWEKFGPDAGPSPAPQPAPAPAPDVPGRDLSRLTAPIAEKLAYQPEKARAVWKAYSGLSDALAGPSGERVENTRTFAAVTSALLEDIDAGGGTPIGREIDEAVAAHLDIEWGSDDDGDEGWEFKSFDDADRRKLVEITGAIAKAAEGVL